MNSTFDCFAERVPIPRFCLFGKEALDALCREYALDNLCPLLPRLQQYFRMREHRDPFLHELLFLEQLAAHFAGIPQAVRVVSVGGDAQSVQTFADLCAKWSTLGESSPPSFLQMMEVAGRYLARAGITPCVDVPTVGTHEQMVLVQKDAPDATQLKLEHATATLGRHAPVRLPTRGVLLLLTPTKDAPFTEECTAFLAATSPLGVKPVAVVGEEGVLVHLLHTGGAMLDLTVLAADAAPLEIPLSAGRHSLLLVAPEQAVPSLFDGERPLSLIGSLTPGERLTVLRGGAELLALDFSLLRGFYEPRPLALHCAPDVPADAVCTFAEHGDTLLGGVSVERDASGALLALATDAWCRGADLGGAALSVLLECPAGNAATAERALPLLLGLHRASAELTLPVVRSSLAVSKDVTPRLSLFLSAKKGTPREATLPQNWQAARDLFFGA